jgi:hypothetical protein
MTPGTYAVILVYSTSYALRAEKLLHKVGIRPKLIPVPLIFNSSTGRLRRSLPFSP